MDEAFVGVRMERPVVEVQVLTSVSRDEVVDRRWSSQENIVVKIEKLLGEVRYSTQVKLDGIRIECWEIRLVGEDHVVCDD